MVSKFQISLASPTVYKLSADRHQEKGSKVNELPCHHTLEQFLDESLAAAGIAADAEGPLFRTWRSGALQRRSLDQSSAHRMVRRRLRQAGIRSLAGNHSFRATGITNYLKNGGKLELAQQMAAHASPRTTSLYDRRGDEISLDEIEKDFLLRRKSGMIKEKV